jgi:hypothetical protein
MTDENDLEDLGGGKRGFRSEGSVHLREEMGHEDVPGGEGETQTFRVEPYGMIRGFEIVLHDPLPNYDASDPWYVEVRLRRHREGGAFVAGLRVHLSDIEQLPG